MYEELYQQNKGLLWRWANRYAPICASVVDIDDLAQAGFLGLVRASETYQEERGAWSTWASYHIRTAMQQTLGRRRNRPSVLSLDQPLSEDAEETLLDTLADENAPDAEELVLRDDLAKTVRDAVDALEDDAMRLAIQEVYLEGRKCADTAERMGTTESRVRGLIAKGCARLARDRGI